MSLRFGQPKQLIKLKNKYLLEWVLDACLASRLDRVVLVLGHAHHRIIQALGSKTDHPRLKIAVNHRYHEGQSRSLRQGLMEIQTQTAAVMFILGDQPMLTSPTIDHLLDGFWHSDKPICVPVWKGKRGNPTIFSQVMYDELMQIEGDVGARNIVCANPENILNIEVDDPLCFLDIDTPQDYDDFQRLL